MLPRKVAVLRSPCDVLRVRWMLSSAQALFAQWFLYRRVVLVDRRRVRNIEFEVRHQESRESILWLSGVSSRGISRNGTVFCVGFGCRWQKEGSGSGGLR